MQWLHTIKNRLNVRLLFVLHLHLSICAVLARSFLSPSILHHFVIWLHSAARAFSMRWKLLEPTFLISLYRLHYIFYFIFSMDRNTVETCISFGVRFSYNLIGIFAKKKRSCNKRSVDIITATWTGFTPTDLLRFFVFLIWISLWMFITFIRSFARLLVRSVRAHSRSQQLGSNLLFLL